jgi:hypothetical protein
MDSSYWTAANAVVHRAGQRRVSGKEELTVEVVDKLAPLQEQLAAMSASLQSPEAAATRLAEWDVNQLLG